MSATRRLLLVNPQITSRRGARFPLSLLALAGSLAHSHECHLVDGNVDRDYLNRIRTLLSRESFDAVGITNMGGPQVRTAIEASMVVRASAPQTPIVWGGYFPTLYSATALNAPYVDYAVRGPAKASLPSCWRQSRGRIGRHWRRFAACRGSATAKWCAMPNVPLKIDARPRSCRITCWAMRKPIWPERFWATAPRRTRQPWDAGSAARLRRGCDVRRRHPSAAGGAPGA